MSRLIKLLNNETIEIVEYSKANACFQTNEYSNDDLFCVIRETINPFDLFQEKLSLEQEIKRLQSIINDIKNQLDYLETYSSKEDVFEDMKRRLNKIENIVNRK